MVFAWPPHRACLLPDLECVRSKAKSVVHRDAPIHLFVAWAVGAALAFLAESYRRYSAARFTILGAEAAETPFQRWSLSVMPTLTLN